MKKLLTPSRTLAVPLLLAYCSSTVVAQSLGTPAADLWIGQPLEISVPARFASNESEDQCVHAEVAYGDKALQGGVRATVVGTDGNRRVRIQADAPIDEAIVTVLLRAGCRNTVTRSYTLLPEIPSETVLAALMRPQAPPLVTAAATPAARAPLVRTPRRLAPAPAATPAANTGGEGAEAVAAAAPHITRALLHRAPARGPRLRLAPIDLDPNAILRVSTTLAEPQGDAGRRATAAMLWQAINADPQDLVRTSALLQRLEGEMAQLRRSSQQTHQDMVDLRHRLEEPPPWYASTRLAALLAVLVAAAAAAAATLWARTRRLDFTRGPWYEAPQPLAPRAAAADRAEAPAQPAPAASLRTQPMAVPVVAPVREAMPVPQAVPAARPELAPTAGTRGGPGPIDFTPPGAPVRPAAGVLRVETLAATFEEVEFLSSLGLATDAMEVLKTYLQDSTSPSPLAYFELMRLCHDDEDPAAVTAVRRRYAQVFGVEAPAVQQVTQARGLDSFPALSERVTRAWDSAAVLDLIEDALFTVPAARDALTLQAGRDLIALHDLAMNLATDAAATSDADAQPLAPWANAEDPAAAQAATQAIADADGGHHFALDVDLGAAPEPLPESAAAAPEPEPALELELAPLIAEMQAAAERQAQARALAEAEDAFSAAVASERAPVSRF